MVCFEKTYCKACKEIRKIACLAIGELALYTAEPSDKQTVKIGLHVLHEI